MTADTNQLTYRNNPYSSVTFVLFYFLVIPRLDRGIQLFDFYGFPLSRERQHLQVVSVFRGAPVDYLTVLPIKRRFHG